MTESGPKPGADVPKAPKKTTALGKPPSADAWVPYQCPLKMYTLSPRDILQQSLPQHYPGTPPGVTDVWDSCQDTMKQILAELCDDDTALVNHIRRFRGPYLVCNSKDPEYRPICGSKSVTRDTGFEPKDVVGIDFHTAFKSSVETDSVKKGMKKCVEEHVEFHSCHEIFHKKSHLVSNSMCVLVLRNPQGTPKFHLLVLKILSANSTNSTSTKGTKKRDFESSGSQERTKFYKILREDVNKAKETAKADELKEAQEKTRLVPAFNSWDFAGIPGTGVNTVLVTNPKMHDNPIVFVTFLFFSLTGYMAKEVYGKNIREFLHSNSPKGEEEKIEDVVKDGSSGNFNLILSKKDGTPLYSKVSIKCVANKDGKIDQVIQMHEITTKKPGESGRSEGAVVKATGIARQGQMEI